ncbi:MAG: murein biosynthesis integral membrane protein MurJ [Candidatus Nanopelagicales bacterium]|nr:murein biosynthesis integral membrane protein MurJ [Candidatus Nanopelagicales bacterium]MDZ4248805.1 murein biosynthesis integral membrane protein MurJ [Candidatus Nanopelagicales bacterium]
MAEDPTYESVNEGEADAALEAQSGLLRNSAVMASGSILSRITGIARDITLTAALGLATTADAFTVGNSLPGIVYVLVIGGALNAVFVPQLVRRMKDDRDGGQAYTDSLLSLTVVILLVVSVAAVALAPWIVSLYVTSDFSEGQFSMTVAFARYCLPQIFFFGLYTMLTQVLNARGRFGPPMFAPILSNCVAIATYLSFFLIVGPSAASDGLLTAQQTAWLGLGTTLGIAAQALILLPVVARSGYKWRFSRRWRGMGMRKAGRLAGWTLGLVAVTQLAFVVVSRLATQANVNAAESGQASAGLRTYTLGYLVFMIPHGIVTVSIVTAMLPNLSRTVHAGLWRAAGLEIGHTMRLAASVITPIALVILLGAQPLVGLLFQYGATNAAAAAQLGSVVSIFILGLLPFTLYYVLQRGWYAAEDTRTPFLFALLLNAVFVGAAVPLFYRAGPGAGQVEALAFAFSAANWVTFVVAWPMLRREYGYLDTRRTLSTLARIAVAGAVAVAAAVLAHRLVLPNYVVGGTRGSALVDLAGIAIFVLGGFAVTAWILRVSEFRELVYWIWSHTPMSGRHQTPTE